jgi:hypothetical protein
VKARHATVLALIVSLAACASSSGIMNTGADTYSLRQSTTGGVLGSREELKKNVIARADAFAAGKGKVAVPVDQTDSPGKPGTMPYFEYHFRLEDKVAPLAAAPAAPAAAIAAAASAQAPTGDYYADLLKLDDLRKKNIITEAEFETLKQRILAR